MIKMMYPFIHHSITPPFHYSQFLLPSVSSEFSVVKKDASLESSALQKGMVKLSRTWTVSGAFVIKALPAKVGSDPTK